MIIHWCEICNNAPSDGVLEVIERETQEKQYMQACMACVNSLEDTDWIENAI